MGLLLLLLLFCFSLANCRRNRLRGRGGEGNVVVEVVARVRVWGRLGVVAVIARVYDRGRVVVGGMREEGWGRGTGGKDFWVLGF